MACRQDLNKGEGVCVPGWFGAGGQVWSLFRKVGSMIRQADQLDKPQARKAVVSLSLGRFCGMVVFLDCMYWKSIQHIRPTDSGWDRTQGSQSVGEVALVSMVKLVSWDRSSRVGCGAMNKRQMLRQQPPRATDRGWTTWLDHQLDHRLDHSVGKRNVVSSHSCASGRC